MADEGKPSMVASIVNAAISLAACALCAWLWIRTRETHFAVLAASFLLRTPVSFHHPMDWGMFTRPFGRGPEPRRPFSPTDGLLSIVSFLLLVVAIGMYAATLF